MFIMTTRILTKITDVKEVIENVQKSLLSPYYVKMLLRKTKKGIMKTITEWKIP